MTLIGDTMMCEQAGQKQLVRDAALAEEAGFDFAVISDHYFPWLEAQGHSPYAWSVLGAAAQATGRIPLMTYATCPIRCYHPAVVAQKAATMQLLWRPVHRRPRGGRESERAHCRRAMAPRPGAARDARRGRRDHPGAVGGRRGDLPGQALRCRVREGLGPAGHRPPIGIAVSGPAGCRLAGRHADAMIAVEARAGLGQMFDAAGGSGKPRIGQIALSYEAAMRLTPLIASTIRVADRSWLRVNDTMYPSSPFR